MNITQRLTVLNFLEFAVWGAYLTCMGNFLGRAGMGAEISWFYAIQGIVSIFMPALIGMMADKLIQPQRMLGICHLIAGGAMLALGYLGASSETPEKGLFIAVYTLSVAFYMPTLALSNSVAFTILKNHGKDTVKAFPPIRTLGTVGFIATMWFVNCATTSGGFGFTLADDPEKFQYTHMQFIVSGVLSLCLFLYALSLPACPLVKENARNDLPSASRTKQKGEGGRNAQEREASRTKQKSLAASLGLDAFRLFKNRQTALFFLFSAMLGMSLQVTNSFATPYITSFKAIPEMADTFGANNATMLVSLSQVAEALCILLIPFFLKRFGIKVVMLIAMFAWVFRFGFFGLGSPDYPSVILFIFSCLVYGVAFDFFNVSGGLYVDQICAPEVRSSGQGLFMLMTNGLGATIGTLSAGAIVNHYCEWTEDGFLLGKTPDGWATCWYIFAGYALVVAVLFMLLFKEPKKQ